MKRTTTWGNRTTWGLFATAALLLFGIPAPAEAGNCECYFSRDCPDPKKEYCNWQAKCTRNCELQIDWKPEWGQPPVAQADCDKWIGPCHDNEPQPPNGDDGDGENCEPPTAANPDTGAAIAFKVMDGMCKKRPTPKPVDRAVQEIGDNLQQLVDLANAGGGPVTFSGDAYVADIMINVAQLALGIYDFSSAELDGESPQMADVRDASCAVESLQSLGNALIEEVHAVAAAGAASDSTEPLVARSSLDQLPIECQTWVQRRTHDCQYPHPPEHQHEFPFADGLECIAEQLGAMARSLGVAEADTAPDNTPPIEEQPTEQPTMGKK